MNNERPFFTIITATCNRPKLLLRAVSSITNQYFTDWELIIVDDSTDNKTKIISEKIIQDSRIRYFKNQKNSGVGYTRNRGIDKAKGAWITFLDDDDYYYNKNSLSLIYNHIQKNNQYKWMAFNAISKDDQVITKASKKSQEYNYIKNYLFGKGFRGDAVHVIRKDVIGSTRIDEQDKTAPEWKFYYEITQKIGNFLYIPINIIVREYLTIGLTQTTSLSAERRVIINKIRRLKKDGLLVQYGPIMLARYIISFKFTHWIYFFVKQIKKLLN